MALLGCIADDFTGATDLANQLVKGGMRTVVLTRLPDQAPLEADAIVVALKSRTNAPFQAVEQSLAALRWLQAAGCTRFYFKYCSTFDSTDKGNIGIVTDALMTELGSTFTIACPAFPEAGRTIFRGHLFVGNALLSDSPMRNHPLTPMLDANLVRVLQRQTSRKVGLVGYETLSAGASACAQAFATLQNQGVQIAVVDATHNADLHTLAAAVTAANLPLVTAGSGLAMALPQQYRAANALSESAVPSLPKVSGPAVVLAGSCSQATLGQVAHWQAAGRRSLQIDPLQLSAGKAAIDELITKAVTFAQAAPDAALIYASAAPEAVQAAQKQLGTAAAGQMLEEALGKIAQRLLAASTRRFVVAGGETSGAVVQALGVSSLRIGPQIEPGVPWCESEAAGKVIAITLKSGNFGSADFFERALAMLD